MKQKNKELLLKDISARLPYRVKCISGVDDAVLIIEGINPNCCGASEIQVTYERSGINFDTKLSVIKPYLYPLSSIEELGLLEEYENIVCTLNNDKNNDFIFLNRIDQLLDFYHRNHLDYNGLIPKGLAINCTNLNIY